MMRILCPGHSWILRATIKPFSRAKIDLQTSFDANILYKVKLEHTLSTSFLAHWLI